MIINLPKIGPVRFADNISPEEFQSQLQALSKKYDFKIPKPDVGIGTLLGRGFMRGLGETGIALGDVLPAMGASALGFENYAQQQLDEATASRAELERKYPTQFKSYTEVSSPFEALQFGAETLGELGPTALTAMVPGLGAGALGSRLAARGAMGAAMEAGPLSLAGRAAAETVAKKAAETAGRRAMYGGVYLGSFAQNAPEVFESIYRETDKMEPGIAALAGGISSILDSVVPGKVLDSLGSYGKMKVIEQVAKESGAAPKVWKYIGKEAAKTAGQEGLTEAAQESINAAAEQVAGSAKGVLDPENIQRYKEAFVKGAVGGSAFGAVSGTSQGLTARKEFRDTKEAEAALKAQMDAEAKAGTLTPERRAEYDIALENARKQREAELQEAFRDTRESEMARMEQIRPAGGYAPDAETQAEIDKMEAEYAKKQEEQQKIDAEKAAGSAFSKVPPTPGTGGLYSPAVEQKRAEQQAATRQFAFGPVATTTPGDPITYDTLKDLKIAERSKVGQQLVGLDLATPDGRRTFIQTIENPGFTGNIDGAVYDDIIATFDPKEVETARAEMKAEVLSPTKQKQQDQTRAFAFGAPDVTRPDTAPVGTSADVSGAPAGGATATTTKTTEPSGVVSTGATTEQSAGREGQQPGALTDRQQRIQFGKDLGAAQSYPGSLQGRKNLPAQRAAVSGDFFGVLTALEKSKNPIIAELARRAKGLGTKIQIDDTAGETYEGRNALQDQMSIDGAKMHLEALGKLRELADTVEQLPEGAALPYSIASTPVSAIQNGQEMVVPLQLRNIAENNNSMFGPLGLPGEPKLRTKEDFKALLDAFERTTQEIGEDKLRLTSTGSATQLGVAGRYDVDTDTIAVPHYFAKDESVLGHEIVHAQASKSVANPTKEQRPTVQRLTKLYDHVRKVVEEKAKADPNFRVPYGIASIQEFISEGISNPDFQYLLSRIKYENSTAWDNFVEAIAKLLGLKNDNALTELLTVYSDLTRQPKPQSKSKAKTDGTATTETKQTETQEQKAPAPEPTAPRSAFARPELPTDLTTVQQKLGTKGAKLDQQSKDAKAYFGKVTPELALDAIANDLVYQPTAYRNAKMKLPSVLTPGAFALTPEPMFGTKEEAGFFQGQGGVHAKNAEAWARANLSPEAVAYLDQKIAQYRKEAERSSKARAKQQKQQDVRKDTKTQVKDEAAAAQAEGEYAPTLEEIEDAKGTKTLAGKRKKSLQRLARELESDLYGGMDDIVDTDLNNLLADETLAAVHTQAHPAILNQLENGNFVGALQGLADSASSEIASRIADLLAGKVGNVKVVYGAQRSMYDPKTNTIYLREGATEYEILHEGTHAALSHVLDNPSHPVTREIMSLFNQLKANVDGAYGAQDIQEFTAEAWSNEDFRNRLREFKPDGQKFTGWERLVNAVRRMFGQPAKHESAYDKLDRLMSEIISPPPETRTGKSLYAQSLGVPNFAQMTMNKLDKGLSKVPHLTADRRTAVWAMLENLTMPMRTLFYKSLNLSAMAEVGTKYFGDRARQFSDQVNEMAGYQEKMLESLQPMHERLTKYRNEQPERHAAFHALINDATIPDIRPYPESESMYKGGGKHAEYLALRNRFIKLTPDEQKLYRDYFATFKALDKEFEKSLKGNLEGAVEDKQRALSAYDKIMQELAALRVDHYAPLFREGQYWLAYNLNGQPVKRMLGTQVERTAARREAEAQGATDFEEYSRVEQIDYTNVPDGTMLASIMKIMKDSGAGEDDINKLIQLVVQALPETSILKSRQQRTGVAGYMNDNAAYVFDRVTSNSVRQIARMRYGQQIKQTLAKMREDQSKLKGDASADAASMLEDLAGRYEFVMNPRISNFAQYASSGAFYWNLAGNVSSALVNILQTPMVVLPQLGGKYGFGASTAALNNARKLYMGSGTSREVQELGGGTSTQKAMYSIENMINSPQGARYKGLVEAMKAHGLLQTSTARDALNSENNNDSAYGPANKLARVTTLVGTFMFHHAERFNRETTAVAAYDLEMQRLKNIKMSDAEKQDAAIREAIRMVEYTHGAGSTLAGPSLGQSDIGKILMVFKRFAFSMYYMLFDTMRRSLPLPENATAEQREAVKAARRQLAGIYGMAAIFAGAKGLPMYWVAEMAYNAFQDEDDDDFDTVMRQYLGEFLYKGPVNYFTNLSIADRVGWTDLIFRENKGDRADASAITQFLEGMLGAPYSILLNMEKGYKLIAEGQWDRGIETMLPAAIKNVLKGGRYALEGANTLRGDAVMGDINGYNAAMQVLGFAPADLLKQYEENAYLTGKQKAITGTEKKLLKQYYMAMREGDGERMSEIETKLYELGDKYPELGISGETIRKSVANRDRISANMYHGVQLNEKLRARLEGAASTVYD